MSPRPFGALLAVDSAAVRLVDDGTIIILQNACEREEPCQFVLVTCVTRFANAASTRTIASSCLDAHGNHTKGSTVKRQSAVRVWQLFDSLPATDPPTMMVSHNIYYLQQK